MVGVPQIDRALAPAPPGALVALAHEPGVEAEPFLYQCAAAHSAVGRPVVYLTFDRRPSAILRDMTECGGVPRRLDFVDAFSSLVGDRSNATWVASDGRDPVQLAALLARAARERPGAVLVAESLSSLVEQSDPGLFEPAWPALKAAMRGFRMSFALAVRWLGDETLPLEDFDAVIGVRGMHDRVVFGQTFAVERAAWTPQASPSPTPYKVLRPGGVVPYVPKVVVTGAYGAGKSTFVQAVSDTAVSVNRLGTTVALDHGRVTLDGLAADVFGTPGQARFDPVLRTIAGQALGVVVVVDSTDPGSFARAREMMQVVWKEGLPSIIAANKQDSKGALSPREVARRLAAPRHVRVVPCVASRRDDARAVLRELLSQVLEVAP
ncbi:MAG TPA: ATP/GTP-binding protein [Candidatus Thermoplasmatota archaeon]|nr:ATP/GTP-binding protein [Candidatus Thermoplasmatota archaeon]